MSSLLTLKRNDRDFLKYLHGTFSRSQRAIPEKTLFKNSPVEETVFRIYELEEVDFPGWQRVLWRALRPEYLAFTLMPTLVTLAFLFFRGGVIDIKVAFFSALGVLLLQISGHLMNDYFDHTRGGDAPDRGGSRIIQRGWVSAHHVRRASWSLLFCGVLSGIPALTVAPSLVLLIGAVTLFGVVEFSSHRVGLKHRGWGEITLMALSGPLLTCGLAWASAQRVEFEVLLIGVIFGASTAYSYFLKNIQELMGDGRGSVESFPALLGFDRAKVLALLWVWSLPAVLTVLAFSTPLPLWGLWVSALGTTLFALGIVLKMSRVTSCLSSTLSQVRTLGIVLHILMGLALTLTFVLEV